MKKTPKLRSFLCINEVDSFNNKRYQQYLSVKSKKECRNIYKMWITLWILWIVWINLNVIVDNVDNYVEINNISH